MRSDTAMIGVDLESEPTAISSVTCDWDADGREQEAVGLRNRVALTTAYAAGLRIREVCRLKVTSIDIAEKNLESAKMSHTFLCTRTVARMGTLQYGLFLLQRL